MATRVPLKTKILIAVGVVLPAWRSLAIWSLRAVLPLMAALLAACNPTYRDPTTGEAAKVTFVNETRGDFLLHAYRGVERCTEPEGIGTLASGSTLTISVEARKAATLSAQYLRGTGILSVEYCIFAGSFRPIAGHSYRLAITPRGDQCFLSFIDQTAPASAQSDRTFVIRKYSTPLAASMGFCSPLSEPERRDLNLSEQ